MKARWCSLKLLALVLGLWDCPRPAAAYYDPSLARWINRDPVAERGGLNLYRFTHNNPANRIDPLGHQPTDVILTATEAAVRINLLCRCRTMISDAMHGAESWADSNYGIPGRMHADEGSVADMLTHCIGACEVAKGEAVCLLAGINPRTYLQDRERGGVRGGDRMDLENNSVGFAVADRGGDCRQGCLDAMRDGQLWSVNPGREAERYTPPQPTTP